MLIAARDAGIKRFVYAASSSTYGDSKKLPKVEEEIGRPLSPYAIIDPSYYRPTEVDLLIGDAAKAKETFGWKAKTKFDELAKMMEREDLKKVIKR